VAQAKKEDPVTLFQAFEVIFSLLSQIDECTDDILFFADEGGSWEVGVDWKKVLPAWFRALSATVGPSEYVRRIATLLTRHYKHGRVEMLVEAERMATPAQRQALTKLAFEGSIAGGS
jgi:hypothetical protein